VNFVAEGVCYDQPSYCTDPNVKCNPHLLPYELLLLEAVAQCHVTDSNDKRFVCLSFPRENIESTGPAIMVASNTAVRQMTKIVSRRHSSRAVVALQAQCQNILGSCVCSARLITLIVEIEGISKVRCTVLYLYALLPLPYHCRPRTTMTRPAFELSWRLWFSLVTNGRSTGDNAICETRFPSTSWEVRNSLGSLASECCCCG
jgi:hypothetical protein